MSQLNPFTLVGEIVDMVRRAHAHQALMPAERAILRAVSALWQTGLAAGLIAVLTAWAQSGGQSLSYATLAQVGSVAAAGAIIGAIAKFLRAQRDPQIAPVAGALASQLDLTAAQLEQRYGGRANSAKRPT